MEFVVFLIAGAIVLAGAVGVISFSHPVHAALALVATLFGIAVLFIAQDAQFLAAVQVIVYAGAIVVLFLFVIMLLGVDRAEDLDVEPLVAQRPAAAIVGFATFALTGAAIWRAASTLSGQRESVKIDPSVANITQIAHVLFTDYVFAFEATAILLTIAVVGAVALARREPAGENVPSRREPAGENVPSSAEGGVRA